MRAVIAVCHPDLEEYIRLTSSLEIVDIVCCREDLLSSCDQYEPDIIIVSNLLSGFISMEDTILEIVSDKRKRTKVVFLYGEDDGKAAEFGSFLIKAGVDDYIIGRSITSKDIDRLIASAVKRTEYKKSNSNTLEVHDKQLKLKDKIVYDIRKLSKGLVKSKIKTLFAEHIIITIYSAHVTGKSHTAWNLAYCLSKMKYNTSVINLDEGYSANIYYGIDDIYYELLDYTVKNSDYKDILDSCYKRKRLNIITGRLGEEESIGKESFLKLLYQVKSKSDITIVDTKTGINDITYAAIENSCMDILVFDNDLVHYNCIKIMLEGMRENFIPEKTIAVINNCYKNSEAYKFIYNQIKRMNYKFKAIVPLSSCGQVSTNFMNTGKVPYQYYSDETKDFIEDMDRLLNLLNIYEKHSHSQNVF